VATRELKVEIIGDASSLQKALGSAGKKTSGFGRALKTAAVGVGAAFAGMAVVAKVGFDELAEGQRVAAQTDAVLKSTGKSAGVTAKGVEDLAGAISRKSGIDDEAIQSGENLLLTFTNIRNEAGKGNDIFSQSTEIMADMSTALGQDMKSSAIQLGKALNDPIKGVTALQRVGVSFTSAQKDQIKALVESGDTMGAQKLILRELNKEFGGSAKAAGETFPGQLNKLKNAFEEAAAGLAEALLPFLTQFADWVSAHMPEIQATFKTAGDIIAAAFKVIGPVIEQAISVIQTAVGIFRKYQAVLLPVAAALGVLTGAVLVYVGVTKAVAAVTKAWAAVQLFLNAVMAANPFVLIAVALIALGVALVVAYKRSATFRKIVQAAMEAVKKAAEAVVDFFTGTLVPAFKTAFDLASSAVSAFWNVIEPIFDGVMKVVQGLVDFVAGVFTGDWDRAWSGVKQIVTGAFDAVKAYLLLVPGLLLKAVVAIGKAIIQGMQDGIVAAWPIVTAWLQALPGKILSLLASAGQWLVEKGSSIIAGLLRGLIQKWVDVAQWYASLPGKIVGFLANAASWLVEKGAAIIGGLLRGLIDKWVAVASWYASLPGKIISAIGDVGQLLYGVGKAILQSLWDGMLAVWNKFTGWVGGLGGKIASLKGPASVDARLLYDNGKLIMGGLERGMRDGWEPIARWLPERADEMTSALKGSGIGDDLSTSGLTRYASAATKSFAEVGQAKDALGENYEAFTETTQEMAASTVSAFTGVNDTMLQIRGTSDAVWPAMSSELRKLERDTSGPFNLLSLALDTMATSLDLVRGGLYALRNAARDTISETVGLLNQLGVLSINAPGMASGGAVTAGQSYVVGESGPELFVPRTSGTIVPNGRGGGGVVVNVYQSGPAIPSREWEDMVRRALYDVQRRNPGLGFA
jgi:hypothetical protein